MADAAAAAPAKPLTQADISRYSNDLTKALQAGSTSPELYLRMLKELRAGVSATEDLLRSTRIGIVVNKLKDEKHIKDDKVRDTASGLIRKWKQDINAKKKDRAPGSPAPGTSSKPAAANGAPPAAAAATGKQPDANEKWRAVKPESRTVATDGVDYKRTGNTTRDNCAKLMYDGLAPMSDHPPSHVLPVALAIEQSCFASLGPETTAQYKEKIRMLFQNLKNRSNSHLRVALLRVPPGITPARFVGMSADEMKSKEMLAADAALHKENMNNAMVAHEEKAISSMLQCGSCGQKKVSYSQAQTRSADEPMTTFCECTVCGKKWKFS